MKDTIWIKKGRFTPLAVVLMFAFPLVTALICLCFGRMNVPAGEVLTALRTALTGESTSNVQNYSIVINLRLPRILMAIIVGAGLSCAGNTYQSLFSNPLATPDILGVTSGTCVGAILAIILSCSILETQLIALVFGLISVCFTLKIAGKSDGRSMVYLVLAGTIASSLFNALGSLLKYTADPQDKLPEITYWLLGSFTSASYQKILIGCPLIVAGIIIIYLLRWRLNILSLSDDEARASGINIKQTQMLFMVDLDSSPTKLIDIVRIGKQLLMTRGSLTTFSIANDVAKYFAIIPALFVGLYPGLSALNIMGLHSPQSAVLSAIIYNALIIIALIPLALKGVKYREVSAGKLLSRNLLVYGLGGLAAPFIFVKLIDILLVFTGLM